MKAYAQFKKDSYSYLGYYVYKLIDPRNGHIFYIGKGKENRVFDHLKGSGSYSEDEDSTDLKMGIINQIHLQGEVVGIVIHRHGMSEEQAFAVEAALIDATPGLTNLAGGHGSNECGPSSVQILNDRYAVEEFVPSENHSLLLINISRSMDSAEVESIYEAVRYAWAVSKANAEKCDYVLAVSDGIVRGVFKADAWLPATRDNFPGRAPMDKRFGFVGKAADEAALSQYLGKRLPERWKRKRGTQSPFRYSKNIKG